MENIESHSIVQTISIVGISIVALSVGIQKLLREWRSNSAENTVIKMMHVELERMGVQNSRLTEELNKLQSEIIELNNQLTKLSIDNNNLQQEVSALMLELNNFKKLSRRSEV